MTYPMVQFVSALDPAAEVRFDFNDAGVWAADETWAEHDGFSLGVPTFAGDPDGVGVELGFRELSFNLVISGDRVFAQRRMSALAREILRRDNCLRFQLDENSRPVWFKTYRSSPGELSFEHVYVDEDDDGRDMWGLGVTLTADPFAYGERVTLPTVTIANDPTAATNPMSYVLPEIKGDAPAPLAVKVDTSGGTAARVMTSVGVVADTYTKPFLWDSAAFTAGTDTGASVSNAAFVGGSYRPVTFATSATMQTRLYLDTTTYPQPGRHLVFARVARSDTTSQFNMRFAISPYGGSSSLGLVRGNSVAVSGTAADTAWAGWVPLGDFTIPLSAYIDAPHGGTGGVDATSSRFAIDAERVSGSGELRIDAVMLVPVDVPTGRATTLFADVPSMGGFNGALLVDGDVEAVGLEAYGTPGRLVPRKPPICSGVFPVVQPDARNALHLILHASGTANAGVVGTLPNNNDSITSSATVTLSYRPRYLYLAGD